MIAGMIPSTNDDLHNEDWPDADYSRWAYGRRVWTLISRAGASYLALFILLGAAMSVVGVSPLVNNGLMPKTLLVFVGLALLIALTNTLMEAWSERERPWLGALWQSWRSKFFK